MRVIALNTIHRTVEPGDPGDKNKGIAPKKPKVEILKAGDVFETSGVELEELKEAGAIRKWTPRTAAGEAKINALLSDQDKEDDDEWDEDDDQKLNPDGTTLEPQWDEEKQQRLAAKAIADAKEQERIDAENETAKEAAQNLGEGTGEGAGDGTAAAKSVSSTSTKATKPAASAAAVKATKAKDGSDLI